ncbi:N-acetylmuramoyl-L-alanine amidase [Arsenicicoccus dermatophilus]|uniref:N-acetylmuramoyl-L-alanine amidase n=1 Tax=Arsenicicoccus dermatophilus TaxID=1076331 RepID=UPI001F4CF437|nr:N-acetylmuramoyl-L-alanine amidase [Arsenicicoccus dermatophilus]MCH8611996.1 N-acetylmuramoyl-L-alanine amidase [Arsenicicoccus dermatophilus]
MTTSTHRHSVSRLVLATALAVTGAGLAGCAVEEAPTGPETSAAAPVAAAPVAPDQVTATPLAVAPVAATRPRPLAGTTIVVDPGHNGGNAAHPRALNRKVYAGNGIWKPCNTTGTRTVRGYPEHAQVWDVATRLAAVLRAQGARVVLTRASDRGFGPCIDQRAAIGNRARATLVVSIHDDGNVSRRARGFHVIHSTRMVGGTVAQQRSARLAVAVRDAFQRGTGMPRSTYLGRGTALTPRTDIGGLNLSRVPAIMVEAGNMRHPTDAALLGTPAFRQREAVALATGIRRYLGR